MDKFTIETNIEKAKKYIEQNNIEDAINLLESLKKFSCNNFNIYFELGKAYLLYNDNSNAINNLKFAKEIENNENVNLLLAKGLKNIKEYRQSISLLLELKKSGNKSREIDEEIVRMLICKGKYIYAKRYIDTYVNLENISKQLEVEIIYLAKSLKNIKKNIKSISLLLKLKKAGSKSQEIDEEIIKILIYKRKYAYTKKYIDKYLDDKYYCLLEDIFKQEDKYSKIQLLELEKICFDLLSYYDNNFKLKIEINLFNLYFFNRETPFINENKFVEYLINKLNICENALKKVYNFMINKLETISRNICLKSKPTNLAICLTNKCNAKCKFCDVFNNQWEISDKIYEELLFLIPYLNNVAWSGGEVFLYKNFKILFDLAKKNNVRQEIVTNAILLDENWINEIVSSNTKLAISIRSVDKINYENLTKGANFNKLIENLKYINSVFDKRHYNFDLSMYTLVTKYNYMELESLIDFANEYNFNNVRLIQLDNTENPIHDENICDKNSKYYIPLKKSLNKLIEKAKQYNISVRCELPIEHDEICEVVHNNNNNNGVVNDTFFDYKYYDLNKQLFCDFPWNSVMLSSGGKYRFNCWCKDNQKFNISNFSLLDFWNCDDVQKFRETIIKKDFYDICASVCTQYTVFR